MTSVTDYFDIDDFFYDADLESTFYHEVGHFIVHKIHMKSINNETFIPHVFIFPGNGKSSGLSVLMTEDIPSEIRIAQLLSGCFFEELYKFSKLDTPVNMFSCWIDAKGSGRIDYNMVFELLQNLKIDVNKMDLIFNLANSFLIMLAADIKSNKLDELYNITVNDYLILEEHSDEEGGNIYKVKIDSLEKALDNFYNNFAEILEKDLLPEIRKIIST